MPTHLVTLDKKYLLKKDIQEKFLPLQIVSQKELVEKIVGAYSGLQICVNL